MEGSELEPSNSELLKALWQDLMQEKKFGIDNIKITSMEEDKKIIEYIKKNKTAESFAFNREEISIGTGIPINRLPYTSIIKIPNIEYILLHGKIWFTYITIWERFIRMLRVVKSIFKAL